jgi:sugar transferase (PEP-CTERM/EpsH1 system associated)
VELKVVNNNKSKGSVLFLCNRIPYPPHRGDKIRSYHMLRRLGDHFDVHVAGFLCDKNDELDYKKMPSFCKSHHFVRQASKGSIKATAMNLFAKSSLTSNLFRHDDLEAWIEKTVAEQNVKCIIVNSLPMAQYAIQHAKNGVVCLADFERVESDSWRQFEPTKGPLAKKAFQKELEEIEQSERELAKHFKGIIFTSRLNARIFTSSCPEASDKVATFVNGVETEYFSPERELPKVFHKKEIPIVFCGAMDEYYNEEAVLWFASEVLPLVKKKSPTATFHVVGSCPSKKLLKAAESLKFKVTGEVDDVRPYIKGAALTVAPVKKGKAVHYKVLESLAMGKPCVMTPHAMEGLISADWLPDLVAGSPSMFADKCLGIINGLVPFQECFRPYIEKNYCWDKLFQRYQHLMKQIL